MKALVYHGNKDLRLEDVPEPQPGPGEVKLRIDHCGICATDIEEYLYGPNFIAHGSPNPITGRTLPLVTGHEITGTVVEAGEGVSNVGPGDRVALNTVLTCQTCRRCAAGEETMCPDMAVAGFALDGGLAEYMLWLADEAIPLPESVTSEQAALVEPASVALHAVRRSGVKPGESMAVLGCGTVGLLAMQAAKAMGAETIALDRRQMSLDLAAKLGAGETIDTSDANAHGRLLELTGGDGPDVIMDAAGGPQTPALAVDWVRPGGRALLVAIYTAETSIDFNAVVAGEKQVIGSLAYQRRDVEEVVELIATGDIDTAPLISDRVRLDEVIDRGFKRMMEPTKDVFRILVSP